MLRRYGPELRGLATLGIAIFGPLATVSFLAVLVTAIGGVHGLVGLVAAVSIPAAVLSVVLYLAVDLAERSDPGRGAASADDGGPVDDR